MLGIIEGYLRDEVVFNFECFGGGVLVQIFMGIIMIKGDLVRNGVGYGSLNKQSGNDYGGLMRGMFWLQYDYFEVVIDCYVFVVKDVLKYMKDCQLDVDVFVVKQVVDVFGMKKGCQVFFEVVRSFLNSYCCL